MVYIKVPFASGVWPVCLTSQHSWLNWSPVALAFRYSAPMTQLGDKIFGSELYKHLHLSAWVLSGSIPWLFACLALVP
jgi:hypothetical protein